MKVCCLASGSKGNMTYVETEDLKLLIDCGLGIRDVESRLDKINVNPQDIDLILITHEHSDHISGINKLYTKYNVKPYVHFQSFDSVREKTRLAKNSFITFYNSDFYIGSTIITPLLLSHDASSCVGFSIVSPSGKMAIITDTGTIKTEVLNIIKNSDVVILEANHNEVMLRNNPNYPIALKKRILSNIGHLSNRQSADYMYKLFELGCKQFVLAHLSENNNTPKLAYMDITEYMMSNDLIEGKDYFIDLAWQDRVGTVYNIQQENSVKVENVTF